MSPTHAQVYPSFNQYVLRVNGGVYDICVEDLNGDETLDIVVLHSRERTPESYPERALSIFMLDWDAPDAEPTQTILADKGEILFDIGDVDSDGNQELIFLLEDGISVRRFVDGRYSQILERIATTSSVFLPHDASILPRHRFILDIDGDDVPEIILPQRHELHILSKNRNGEFRLVQRLWTSPEYTLPPRNAFTQSLKLPVCRAQDYNGDGFSDILAVSGDRLDVFLQYPQTWMNPQLSLTPPDLRYRMSTRNVSTTVLESLTPISATVETRDLNGDGYVDIIVTQGSRATFTHRISQIQVYMNKQGRYDILPDHVFTAENFGGEHIIQDFNGDGLQDFALLTFKIGFAQAIKFLLTKKAGNAFDIYPMRSDHTYPLKSVRRISFSRSIRIDEILGSTLCHSFEGDFNGDGLRDILIGTGDETITVFPGHPQTLFTKKPSLKISAATSPHLWVGDLNQDDYSDIILWYPMNEDRDNQVRLILSEAEGHP
jgi:hypothetical protein